MLAAVNLTLIRLLQDDGGLFGGTSLIILLIILALILALFWWGLTRNRSTSTAETNYDTRDTGDTYGRFDRIEDDVVEPSDLDSGDLDLEPADLNVGRVPDPFETPTPTTTLPPEAEAAARTGAALVREPEPEPDQPIHFDPVVLDASGTAPPGDQVRLDLPPTTVEPVDVDMTGNVPPVLEDESELIPGEPGAMPANLSSTGTFDAIPPAMEMESPAMDVPGTEMPGMDLPGTSGPDDLKLIEGIGPRIAALLAGHGITTFSQLSDADPIQLRAILDQANLPIADPESWPEQARLAAAGRLDDLRLLQDQLRGGRTT